METYKKEEIENALHGWCIGGTVRKHWGLKPCPIPKWKGIQFQREEQCLCMYVSQAFRYYTKKEEEWVHTKSPDILLH